MAQLVRAPPCHGGGRRFESDLGRLYGNIHVVGILAQLGEHLPYKQRVIGSSPIGPIFMFEMKENVFMRMHRGVFLCFGINCIYGTLTKNERIAMME